MSDFTIAFENIFEQTDKLLKEAIGVTSLELDLGGLENVLVVLAEQIARKRLGLRYFASQIVLKMSGVVSTGKPDTLLGSSLSRDYEAAVVALEALDGPWKAAVSAYKREHPAKG